MWAIYKERIQKFKETRDISYIYENELDKVCFQLDIAYGDFKDLKRRTASDKFLRDKAFNIAKNRKYDGYQKVLASMVDTFFDKKSASLPDKSGSGSGVNTKVKHNEQLAKELHKPIIRNFKKRIVYSGYRDKIWGTDLADMQLISKFDKGSRFFLCKRKIFLLKDTHQTGLKNFLLLVKLKMQFHGHILLTILMVKKLLEHFMKKNYERLINNNLG